MFLYDFDLPNSTPTHCPQREPFVQDLLQRLNMLTEEAMEATKATQEKAGSSKAEEPMDTDQATSVDQVELKVCANCHYHFQNMKTKYNSSLSAASGEFHCLWEIHQWKG